jgi:hypothetical protein
MAWRSLPNAALGVMVEVFSHRSPRCSAVGHQPVWKTDRLVCGRHGCRQSFPASTRAILDEFATLESLTVVARELRRVEGQTTSDEPGAW